MCIEVLIPAFYFDKFNSTFHCVICCSKLGMAIDLLIVKRLIAVRSDQLTVCSYQNMQIFDTLLILSVIGIKKAG